jgi:hypothetical protein
MRIKLINDNDGNDEFVAEGDTLEDALIGALTQLGWCVTEEEPDEETE